ncbi:ABC transporter ATP-binding protein [Pigmentiphaga soli]|uniref:ABC transporter ATP-binding protein n=1 Tax=Pigmentiphaga soli TaxID=1007095 RepID=A0ABP8GHS1_9BURK
MAAPVLQAQGAARRFPNGTQALAPVTLDVGAGEFVSLLGPSGCGKTTLLRLFAGLDHPSAGRIGRGPEAGRLSYVFQDPTLMPWATVARNVRLPFDLRRGPGRLGAAERQRRVDAALKRVGLGEFADALPHELSGGMRMRVSIARALVTDPAVLLMDEPFGALDDITRQRLDDDLLAVARAQRLTVVFVTHSIFEAVYLSSRVIVMSPRPGRVTADIPIDAPVRDAAFRVSPEFARFAARLQAELAEAHEA